MLVEDLANCKTIEEAAEEFCGNWRKWQTFVWFGAKDVPHSDQFLLGYVVNHEGGNNQETNLRIIKRMLAPWYGDVTTGKTVGDFGADFCGDKGLFTGIMVRVKGDEGEITDAFRVLYETALYLDDNEHNPDALTKEDKAIYDEVNLRYFRDAARDYLPALCKRRKIKMTDALVDKVAAWLAEDDFDGMDADGEIEENVGQALEDVG